MASYQVPNFDKKELMSLTKKQVMDLVKLHNVHTQIKGYSKLKKDALVEQLMKFSGKLVKLIERGDASVAKPSKLKPLDVHKPTSDHIKKKTH